MFCFSAEPTWFRELVDDVAAKLAKMPEVDAPSGNYFCGCRRCVAREAIILAAPRIVAATTQGLAEIRRVS